MRQNRKVQGLLDRKLADPVYRRRFERAYAAFELEVQILNALEKKGWSYNDLAKAMHTSKGNISRDLSAGKINSATVSRIVRIGQALGMVFLPLFIPRQREKEVLAKLQELVVAQA